MDLSGSHRGSFGVLVFLHQLLNARKILASQVLHVEVRDRLLEWESSDIGSKVGLATGRGGGVLDQELLRSYWRWLPRTSPHKETSEHATRVAPSPACSTSGLNTALCTEATHAHSVSTPCTDPHPPISPPLAPTQESSHSVRVHYMSSPRTAHPTSTLRVRQRGQTHPHPPVDLPTAAPSLPMAAQKPFKVERMEAGKVWQQMGKVKCYTDHVE